MRKETRKQISLTVTSEQHAIAMQLAGNEGISAYIRRLIAQDAVQRGADWPANLPRRGTYKRGESD